MADPETDPKAVRYEQTAPPEIVTAATDDHVSDEDREALAAAGVDNAADPRAVRTKAKRQKEAVESRQMVLQSLLQVDAGRDFIAWLICDLTGVFGASINGALQSEFSMHREGQRAIGLVLQDECLRAAPDNYLQAIQRNLTQRFKK